MRESEAEIGIGVAAALALVLTSCAAPGGDGASPPDTVRAQRYTIRWVDSAMDLVHGGGVWVEELYFPDLGVACTLRTEQSFESATGGPVLDAFPADRPRNELTGLGERGPSPIEEVSVPRALAEEIAALARLGARMREESRRLGAAAAQARVLREAPAEPADPAGASSR